MSWFLTLQPGYRSTMKLPVKNKPVASTEALTLGLVSGAIDDGEINAAAERWAGQLPSLQSHVMLMTKNLLHHAADASWKQAIALEAVDNFLKRKGQKPWGSPINYNRLPPTAQGIV